jgi:hypothetical protein
MKALELIRRINRARAKGEDVSVLERELAEVTAPKKRYKPPRKELQRAKTVNAEPHRTSLLRQLLRSAERRGKPLGWVMFEFKRIHGSFPGRALWHAVVGRDTRDAVIDAYVDRVAREAKGCVF